ncbi:MAG: alkaline phosphatase D family protein [Planctomycetota bacterium]|jgi:hypothetical protein
MKRVRAATLGVLLVTALLSSMLLAQPLAVPQVQRDKVICFALYTVHDNILKLTAQLYPLEPGESRDVRLETERNGEWRQIAQTQVIEQGWTAPFRVENWDSAKDIKYRVAHGSNAYYTGTIRKNPIDKDVIVVAAFTGNSINPNHGGDIPKSDIVENIKRLKPDLLFFSGDQVYDHFKHYAAWLKFGRDFGEIIRNIPTVSIPDDHDVGQANLWGQSGRPSYTRAGHDGGYAAPVEYVKEVERAQTSHLPDPFDPTPIERGIGVYYTDLTIGRVSFAIIEDRKFKTGPAGLLPDKGWRPSRPDHISKPGYDPAALDVPEARLLGERQLKFLRHWAADWHDCDMKAVLSQTIFAGGAHVHGAVNNRLLVDLDSNGWPQSGRNRALIEFRKAFALMIAGDQHLATIIHHGVNNFNDSGYSMCVPSIANLYLRWWAPLEPGKNREPGAPEYTGEFLDGLGNKVTMLAVANPSPKRNGGNKLTTRAAGFGVVKFNVKTRKITMECWPRNVDITDPATKQYPGWPRTIDQMDNYARQAVAYLPTVDVSGMTNPVVQIIDESNNETVYTVRISGTSFRPKVFKTGRYTITVGEQGTSKMKTLRGIQSAKADETKNLKVQF